MIKTIDMLLATYDGNRTPADVEMRQWVNGHRKEYNDFCSKMIMGDTAVYSKLQKILQKCLPREAKAYFLRMAHLVNGKIELDEFLLLEPGLEDEAMSLYEQKAWLNASPELSSLVSDLLSTSGESFSEEEMKQAWEAIVTLFMSIQQHSLHFVKDFLENMRMKAQGKDGNMFRMMYSFATFDGGMTKMMTTLNGCLTSPFTDLRSKTMARSWIPHMVHQSIFVGIENKETWTKCAETCGPDVWKDIMFSLRDVSTSKTHKANVKGISDICVGELQLKIKEFLKENTELVCMAYLLKALVLSGQVDAGTKYMTFHRAIEQMLGKKMNHALPQRRYGEIKTMDIRELQFDDGMEKAKAIIERWKPIFSAC